MLDSSARDNALSQEVLQQREKSLQPHALNMHINLDKGDNIQAVLEKLAKVEGIENTFDIESVSEVIQTLDSLTQSTDFSLQASNETAQVPTYRNRVK